jgi:hypothetical protein
VKKPTPLPRASHVNDGTSVPHEDLPWPEHSGTVLRHHKLHLEHDDRPDVTNLGGLVLPLALLRRVRAAQIIDKRVQLLKVHLPYHESDHVLSQALMLYAGGTCLEDMALLQQDPALLRMLGAERTPDPTTSGDFLRRFVPDGELENLRSAVDEIQERVWSNPRRWNWRWRRRSKEKRPFVVLYLDGKTKELIGVTREGADFDHKGRWSYNVLVASLDDGECVALRLRSGNVRSSDGAAELLDELLPRLLRRYQTVLVVADSDFDRFDIRYACERHQCYYAFVGRELENRPVLADGCTNWRPFRTRAHRMRQAEREQKGADFKKRRKKGDRRRRRARQRGYTDLKLVRQHVGEIEGPDGARLILRRQLIDEERGKPGQRELWEMERYRYVVTNLPREWTPTDIVDATYLRCDQENLIEGMGSGIAAWRMPVAEMRGNAAWLEIARLAWNLGKWIAYVALGKETSRWEWKRFRRCFVDFAVQVVRIARQTRVRILGAHRFAGDLLRALRVLQV